MATRYLYIARHGDADVFGNLTGTFPSVSMFNDMSHLPPELRWTGFPATLHP